MNYVQLACWCTAAITLSACAATTDLTSSSTFSQATQAQHPRFSAGGYAQVDIQRPLSETFATLTNANLWPTINQGITKAITPEKVVIKQGIRFKESIASPITGVNDWTNEWLVESFEPGKRFVISGIDHFSSIPIHSRITYEFAAKNEYTTTFKRGIEVAIDQSFIPNASKAEVEALYRFLGSQWEMANHLKLFMESYPVR